MSGTPDAELVEVLSLDPTLAVELRYAGSGNVFKKPVYTDTRCLLARGTARRLVAAQRTLRALGLGLKVWDAFRPRSVQKALWELLPDERFVAPPERGSRHNRGAAVDVTLIDGAGRELELPSDFDEFGEPAHRSYKGMSAAARGNLAILERAMAGAGFVPLAEEWWHYDDPDWAGYAARDEAP